MSLSLLLSVEVVVRQSRLRNLVSAQEENKKKKKKSAFNCSGKVKEEGEGEEKSKANWSLNESSYKVMQKSEVELQLRHRKLE